MFALVEGTHLNGPGLLDAVMLLPLPLELLISSCHLQLPQLCQVRGTRKLLLLLLQQATGSCLRMPHGPSEDGCKWPRSPPTGICWLLLVGGA